MAEMADPETWRTWTNAQIANTMNRLAMVEWDRLVRVPVETWDGTFTYTHVYGWIRRDDGFWDFVFLNFTPWASVPESATSSARWSKEITRLTHGPAVTHNDCLPIIDDPLGAKVERFAPWAARAG